MTSLTSLRATFILGLVSVVAVLLSHLALTDIRHSEADVVLEWQAVYLSLAVIVAFQAAALVALRRIIRRGGG